MRRLIVLAALLAVFGCGDDKAQPGNPSAEQVQADLDEQKKVELEERGTPVKPKGTKGKTR